MMEAGRVRAFGPRDEVLRQVTKQAPHPAPETALRVVSDGQGKP
jgi:ABC-type protease/lipase transport system fused ATPase/permease subunit